MKLIINLSECMLIFTTKLNFILFEFNVFQAELLKPYNGILFDIFIIYALLYACIYNTLVN